MSTDTWCPVFLACACAAAWLGCGASGAGSGAEAASGGGFGPGNAGNGGGGTGGGAPVADAGVPGGAGRPGRDVFVPEEESFVVQEVAATDDFVFVPNTSSGSNTVARIRADDLGVRPLRVGGRPASVRARQVEGVGAVAYVLSEESSTVSIIRSDESGDEISFVSVPEEVNALELSPDGRHLLAYIDPDEPLPEGTGAASLQVMAVVELGQTPAEDRAFQLSVTRLVREIEFTEDGSEAYVVGRSGINHLMFDQIDDDAFVPPLELGLSTSVFPPKDREIEVGPQGDVLVVRSSEYEGLALFRPSEGDGDGRLEQIDLPAPPTDIDLERLDGELAVVATLRTADRVAVVDVEGVFDSGDPASAVRSFDVQTVSPGLAAPIPERSRLLLYSTVERRPRLGVLNLKADALRAYQLYNKVRSVAVAPGGSTAVVVHERRSGAPPAEGSAVEQFQHSHGVTIFDIESGYQRPVTLEADPEELVVTTDSEGTAFLYAIFQSDAPRSRGVVRIDLSTYRRDFIRLPRKPVGIGRIADYVYVTQSAEQGRITFFDVDSGDQQTISGYELNARIE